MQSNSVNLELHPTLLSRALWAAGEQEYLLPLGIWGCWQSFQRVLARRQFCSLEHAENTFLRYVKTAVLHAISKDLKHRARLRLVEAGDAGDVADDGDDQPQSGHPVEPEREDFDAWRAGVGDADTERLIDFARQIDVPEIQKTAGVGKKQAKNRLRACAEKIGKLKQEQAEGLFPDEPIDYRATLDDALSKKKNQAGRPRKNRKENPPEDNHQGSLFDDLDDDGEGKE